MNEIQQDQVKTDQIGKDHEESKNAEMVTEKARETNNISNLAKYVM